MNSYTILENGYIERITEEGLISIIPNDPANSDYQAYLNKDNPDWGKGTIS